MFARSWASARGRFEWDEEGDEIVVRRAGQFTSLDIRLAVFAAKLPKPQTLDELKEGIRQHVRERHARR
ncbi:MAG: hypothetical protein ABSG41_19770 [Bryobacteraceae bacterium]|jgi:hypothetical protein